MNEAPNIATMDATAAGARLRELTADPEWSGRLMKGDAAAKAEFHALTEKVTGLTAPASAPSAVSARAALDKFVADPGIAAKLIAGDGATNAEFARLSAAAVAPDERDLLVDMLAGAVPGDGPQTLGEVSTRDKLAEVQRLHEAGLSDAAVAEAFLGEPTGGKYDAATIARVEAVKSQRLGDPAWVQRLMAGGWAEKRDFTLWSVVLANAS